MCDCAGSNPGWPNTCTGANTGCTVADQSSAACPGPGDAVGRNTNGEADCASKPAAPMPQEEGREGYRNRDAAAPYCSTWNMGRSSHLLPGIDPGTDTRADVPRETSRVSGGTPLLA